MVSPPASLSRRPTRSPQGAPGQRPGGLAVAQHRDPVHDDVPHAHRVPVRGLERRAVCDRGGVEDHHVGEVARARAGRAGRGRGSPPAARTAAARPPRAGRASRRARSGRAGARSCRRRAGGSRTSGRAPSGAIEPASEPNDTQGSRICRLTFSSDIRKNTTPIRDSSSTTRSRIVSSGLRPRSAATSASVFPVSGFRRLVPEGHELDALGRPGQPAQVLPARRPARASPSGSALASRRRGCARRSSPSLPRGSRAAGTRRSPWRPPCTCTCRR